MILLVIITGIIIIILAILAFTNIKFRENIIRRWPEYSINFLLVMIAAVSAIWGVNWAFQKETIRNKQDQQEFFRRSFYAIMMENSDTIVLSKRLKSGISESVFRVGRFSSNISSSVLNNPMLYKYSGNEYIVALSTYTGLVNSTNQLLDHYYSIFMKEGKLENKHVEHIKKKIDNLLYYTYILQIQSQVYVWAYGDFQVYVPPNQKQIFSYLTEEDKYTLSELEHELKAASKQSAQYGKFLEQDMSKFWEDFISWQEKRMNN